MSMFPLSRLRLTIAVVTVLVLAGLGTLGAIRVDARAPAQARPPHLHEANQTAITATSHGRIFGYLF